MTVKKRTRETGAKTRLEILQRINKPECSSRHLFLQSNGWLLLVMNLTWLVAVGDELNTAPYFCNF
jgi:hypothetical protein